MGVDLATYLINEKRSVILDIEQNLSVQIVVLPNEALADSHYEMESVMLGDSRQGRSYKQAKSRKNALKDVSTSAYEHAEVKHQKAAVGHVSPDKPAPKQRIGFWRRLFGLGPSKPEKPARRKNRSHGSRSDRDYSRRRSNSNRGGRSRSRRPRSHSNGNQSHSPKSNNS